MKMKIYKASLHIIHELYEKLLNIHEINEVKREKEALS